MIVEENGDVSKKIQFFPLGIKNSDFEKIQLKFEKEMLKGQILDLFLMIDHFIIKETNKKQSKF